MRTQVALFVVAAVLATHMGAPNEARAAGAAWRTCAARPVPLPALRPADQALTRLWIAVESAGSAGRSAGSGTGRAAQARQAALAARTSLGAPECDASSPATTKRATWVRIARLI